MLRRTLSALCFSLSLLAFTSAPGCAALLAVLPTIAEVTSDAVAVLGLVQSAVSRAHPDPSTQVKIADAIAKAQQALVLGEQTLAGVQDASAGQYAAAFAAFAQAWEELMALVQPLGIVPAQPGAVAPDAGVRAALVQVPVPLVLRTAK